MAHFVGTPEMESRNCPGWTPGTLNGHSSSPRARIGTSLEIKVVALVESFPTPCRTFQGDVGKRSIPDF